MLFLFIKAQLGNLVNKGKKTASLDRARYTNHFTLTSMHLM
jgi:hypothetical protein